MSSHREAPQISKDPTADSTDLYAFVSPDDATTVTLIANYIPLEPPDGGPNFFEFADDVLYTVNIDNTGEGVPNIVYEFAFRTTNHIPSSFLYNDGPITALTGSGAVNWNRRQSYTLTRVDYGDSWPKPISRVVLGAGLPVPPCNIGPLSTPDYASLASQAIVELSQAGYTAKAFAGQRADGFYVDLGAIFDLGDLRPFEEAHANFGLKGTGLLKAMPGVNSLANVNVHSLALQIPVNQLTRSASRPSSVTDPAAVIGIWTAAYRQKVLILDNADNTTKSGPYVQVSRLGSPLVNELLIGIGQKDYWNSQSPSADKQFLANYSNPLLAQLLPVLYPGVFPNLAKYNTVKGSYATNTNGPNRADLVAVLLTGVPASVLPSAPTYSGTGAAADELRLNVAVPPAKSSPSNLGVLGGDVAGFPNGRRVFDDVATIELIAVAGATLGLVDTKFTPDAAAKPGSNVSFGLTSSATDTTARGTVDYLPTFPYLGTPWSGMWTPLTTPNAHLVAPGA
ncbi:MAG TPA: DUF4331 domain-containing protein [Acidimicrobiales bacterium]|nr:DUF4331 domain-containing protein [Acidimicrobiales bacterium]